MKYEIEWGDATTPPDVRLGGANYFLVANKKGYVFTAYYLNMHPLVPRDDCPDACAENNYAECENCKDSGHHLYHGWHDTFEDSDGEVFKPIPDDEFGIVAWARLKKFDRAMITPPTVTPAKAGAQLPQEKDT